MAIKKVPIRNLQDEKVRNEIDIQKRIKQKWIVKIYDEIQQGDDYYIIMEMCDSITPPYLANLAKRLPQLSRSEALEYFQQILSAMEVLSKKKVLHRDLKLENILLKKNKVPSPTPIAGQALRLRLGQAARRAAFRRLYEVRHPRHDGPRGVHGQGEPEDRLLRPAGRMVAGSDTAYAVL